MPIELPIIGHFDHDPERRDAFATQVHEICQNALKWNKLARKALDFPDFKYETRSEFLFLDENGERLFHTSGRRTRKENLELYKNPNELHEAIVYFYPHSKDVSRKIRAGRELQLRFTTRKDRHNLPMLHPHIVWEGQSRFERFGNHLIAMPHSIAAIHHAITQHPSYVVADMSNYIADYQEERLDIVTADLREAPVL